MGKYDDLFAETTPEDSVFADKGTLDPFADPEEIVAREEQERALARILTSAHEGYLPPTVSIYGPLGPSNVGARTHGSVSVSTHRSRASSSIPGAMFV